MIDGEGNWQKTEPNFITSQLSTMPGCVRAQIHEFLFVIFFDFFGITAHGQQKDAVRCIWEFLLRVSYSNKITSYASFRRMFSSEKPRRAYSRSISRATAAINASISASVFRMGGRVYHTICMEKNIQTNKITCPPRSLRRPCGLRRLWGCRVDQQLLG